MTNPINVVNHCDGKLGIGFGLTKVIKVHILETLLPLAFAVALLCTFSPNSYCQSPEPVSLPTTDQISTVLDQVDQSLSSIKLAVSLESGLPSSRENRSGVKTDKEGIADIEAVVSKLRKNPESFNGPLGFMLFPDLDDLSRNAALCEASASSDAAKAIISGDKVAAYSALNVQGACFGASTASYEASQGAYHLFLQELLAQSGVNDRAAEALTKMTEALKACKR
ncbi:MAG: hypothetical protein WA634_17890 [Silvibacterium sp.]